MKRNYFCQKLHKNLFNKLPQHLVNYKLFNNSDIILKGGTIKKLLHKYSKNNDCDVLLRKSGTENLLRLMVQAKSKGLVEKIVKEFLIEIKKLDETDKIYKMLSIAGSDNTCGAGIQADIKTCQALNAYCLTCVTTITSQNSNDVFKIYELPSIYIKSQINSILKDYKVDCIKIGLISSISQAKAISQILSKFNSKVPIVVDPIFKSSTNRNFNNLKNYASIYRTISKISSILHQI